MKPIKLRETRLMKLILGVILLTHLCNPVFAQNQFSSDLNDYVFDLSSLFENDKEFEKGRLLVLKKIKELESLKNLDLSLKKNLIKALDLMYMTRLIASKMSRYGFMRNVIENSPGTNNLKNIGIEKESQVEGEVAFIEEAIRKMSAEKLQKWIREDAQIANHKRRINKILWEAPHTLPANEQKIIETIHEWTKKPYYTYLSLLSSNLGWSTIKLDDGNKLIVNQDTFDKHKRDKNDSVREKVLKTYFYGLKNHQKSFGQIITNRIEAEAVIAKLRGFRNGMDALWYLRDGMPAGSYDPMINVVNKNLDVINRFIDLKRRILKKDKFTYYDLYAPFSKISKNIKIDEALNISIEGSKSLGEKYQKLLKEKINSKLVHLAPTDNKNKYYYGISQPIGDAHPYIIMTYNDNIASAESLMGALTALMKSEMIPLHQRPDTGDDAGIYGNSTIYIGTSLFSDYLYKQSKSKEERIAILSTSIERIWARVYRYVLVTEWEKEIGDRMAQGNTPSGDELSKMYIGLIKKYYKDIDIPDEVSAEWMTYRIPFYSYEHQFWPAAMAGACAVINKLNDGDKNALKILEVLGRGDLDLSYPLYKEVGIDLTTEAPYLEVVKRMNYLMDLLEKEI